MKTIRFISMFLGLLSVIFFYLIDRQINNNKGEGYLQYIKTLQFYFFPLFFPYFFVIYTDMFSLALVLASLFFMMRKKYVWSGFFSIASFLVRQSNVIWLVFIAIYGYMEQYGFEIKWENIMSHLKRIWIFILGIFGFGLFVLWNGGIAMGDKTNHEAGIYLGNFYFMLFMFFVFFLPMHIENFSKIIARIKKYPALILVPIAIALLFLVADPQLHPYNLTSKFLRNYTLMFIYSNIIFKVIYAALAGYTSLSLLEFGLSPTVFIFFLFAILSVIPEWLIEQRYFMVVMALFMLFRKNKSATSEYVALGAYIIVSLYFFYSISNNIFMP